MTLEELIDGFIKHLEQHRRQIKQIMDLRDELEKWQAVAVNAIPEEGLIAALNAYDARKEIVTWN
jgi:hypothetical protein